MSSDNASPEFFAFAREFLGRVASTLEASADRDAAIRRLLGELESKQSDSPLPAQMILRRAAIEILFHDNPILADRAATLKTDSYRSMVLWIRCAAEAVTLQRRSAAIAATVDRWPGAARALIASAVDQMESTRDETWRAFDAVESSILAPDDSAPRPLPRFDAAYLRWRAAIQAVEAIVQGVENEASSRRANGR